MGREAESTARPTKVLWKSDQLIVVRERESRLHGEGADGYIMFVMDTYAGHVGLDNG